MKFVFIFIDGVGVGPSRTETNPIARVGSSLFPTDLRLLETAELPFEGIAKAIDANLGVPGLPQSATGQSTLFTGVNTPKMLGYHLFAFPNKEIRALLYRQNILKDLRAKGGDAVFVNGYPGAEENFLEKKVTLSPDGGLHGVNVPEHFFRKFSVTTVMALASGQDFYGLRAMKEGKSIGQDFTNRSLLEKFPELPEYTPTEAGEQLAVISGDHDLIVYEYFQTDRAGHSCDWDWAMRELSGLEAFLSGLLGSLDLSQTSVVVTSDHGNIEDLSTRGHTGNPIPLLLWGPARTRMAQDVASLVDVTPGIVAHF